MSLKITLITPPDIYQNDSPSIFLMNLVESEQDRATAWLAKSKLDISINIYFYQNEMHPSWFLHALAVSQHKYIDIDNTKGLSEYYLSYVLGKDSVYFRTSDTNKSAVFNHINFNKVNDVCDFLERVISEEK